MDFVNVRAYAKINLSLDIIGKRSDGYHLLQTVMQSINLFDEISIKKTFDNQITVICDGLPMLSNKDNIVYKCAMIFFNACGIFQHGLEIRIKKNIPIGGGLGGGSADGAATLHALNRIYETNLSIEELCKIGEKVGADLPFCIIGGTAFVEGIGEKITPIVPIKPCFFVIAKPIESVNTKLAFEKYDEIAPTFSPSTQQVICALQEENIIKVACNISNVFEQVITLPEIANIKEIMRQSGSLNQIMTGSGSCIFAMFLDKNDAEKCKYELAKKYKDVFLCQPIDNKIIFDLN